MRALVEGIVQWSGLHVECSLALGIQYLKPQRALGRQILQKNVILHTVFKSLCEIGGMQKKMTCFEVYAVPESLRTRLQLKRSINSSDCML